MCNVNDDSDVVGERKTLRSYAELACSRSAFSPRQLVLKEFLELHNRIRFLFSRTLSECILR